LIRSIFLTVNNDLPLTTSLSRSNPENQELNRIEQEQERKESKRGSPSRGAAILILWPSFTSSQPNPLNLRIPLPSRRREMDSISHLHTPIIPSSSHSTPGATGTPSSPAANSNSPHHSSPNHPSYQKGSSPPTSSNNNYQNHGLPIPSSGAPASVIAQYGLMTPMGSGAFGNSVFNNGHGAPTNGQPPFVSPLDMPHGHGNEMDGHHMNHQPWRGQDVSTKRGGGKEFGEE
jgi:hypothetical protein